MENDQTIFKREDGQEPNAQPLQPTTGVNPNLSPYPPLVSPLPSQETTGVEPINPNSRNGIKFKGIRSLVKIFIGIVVVSIILAVLFFVVLPAFNSKKDTNVTLTYWGLWEDSKVMGVIISDFERVNPNIKINYIKEDLKQYRETLVTRVNNGTGPDIFTFHNTWYPMFSNILLPFPSSTISKNDFANSFYLVMQNDLIKNGAIYGIPMNIDTLSLYINSDLFKNVGLNVPKTWTEFLDTARVLTVKDQNGKIQTAGGALGTYSNVTHAPDILSLLFLQNGVDFNDINNSSDRINGALKFFTSFTTDPNNIWDLTLDPSILAFSKGNLAMFFGYSWDYFTIKAANPNLNFTINPVPQLPNQDTSLASYWAAGVSAKSLHQRQALLFLQFLAKKETEEKLYAEESKQRDFGEPYARIDLGEVLKTNPLLNSVVSQGRAAKSSYFVDSTLDNGLNQELNAYLENAVNGIVNGSSVESASSVFSQGVSQVLQKYGAH